NCLEKSEKRGVQAAGNGPSETGSVGSALERFSFVLRTSWVWAGSTIPLAPKERQFIAWGRQNKLHIGRKPSWPKGFTCTRHISIGALGLWPICNLYVSPRTRRHVKRSLFQPRRGTGASRGRALLSPRLGLGTGKGRGRFGTSWGLRLQAMNCRRYAAGENTDHLQPVNPRLWAACVKPNQLSDLRADLQPVNPRLWAACGRCECKPL